MSIVLGSPKYTTLGAYYARKTLHGMPHALESVFLK